MRLTDESTAKFEIKSADEQVRKIKQYINDCQVRFGKIMGCGTCKALQLCTWTKELCDTIECMRKHIEALQQENEQLKDENASIRNWNACEEKLYNELLESDKRHIELEEENENFSLKRAKGGYYMICPNCPGNVEMIEIDEHWQCGICNGQWWPPEKPEKIYQKSLVKNVSIDSPELMLWHEEDMNYKPPLPAGVPVYKGGSKNSRKRKKKPKIQISNVNYL